MNSEVYVQATIVTLLTLFYLKIWAGSRIKGSVLDYLFGWRVDRILGKITIAVERTGNPKSLVPTLVTDFILQVQDAKSSLAAESYLDLVAFYLDNIASEIISAPCEYDQLTSTSPFIIQKDNLIEQFRELRRSVRNKEEEGIFDSMSKIVALSLAGKYEERKTDDKYAEQLARKFARDLSELSDKLMKEKRKIASLYDFTEKWHELLEEHPDPELILIWYSISSLSQNLARDIVHIDVEVLLDTLKALGFLISKLGPEISRRDRKGIFTSIVQIYRLLEPFS
jgi:hypothetical protein